MTKRRAGKHTGLPLGFEGFGKAPSGLGHEHSCGRGQPDKTTEALGQELRRR